VLYISLLYNSVWDTKVNAKIIRIFCEGINPVLLSTMSKARPISRHCHVNLKHVILILLSYCLCKNEFKIMVTLELSDYTKIERKIMIKLDGEIKLL
jgi:hypothetical protein